MSALKHLSLVVFIFVIATHNIKDVFGARTGVSGNAAVSISISGIFKLPFKIFKAVLSVPFKFISNAVKFVIDLLKTLNGIRADLISDGIGLIKQIIEQIVNILVDLGVLQGKTAEEIVNSAVQLVIKLINFIVGSETKLSTFIVDVIKNFINKLNIKEILQKIADLPIVKQLVSLINKIRVYIQDNFQNQINDIIALIKSQFDQHKDFFQPIFDGISSRILIISNALQALVTGDLKACAKETNPEKSPTGSLQWELNKLIYEVVVRIFKILGFQGLAEQYQEKLNETYATEIPLQPGSTILPPILSTLAEDTSPPFGSVTTMA